MSLDPAFAPEPQLDFEVVEIKGAEFEILLYEDGYGQWVADCNGVLKYARFRATALEAIIEVLEIE